MEAALARRRATSLGLALTARSLRAARNGSSVPLSAPLSAAPIPLELDSCACSTQRTSIASVRARRARPRGARCALPGASCENTTVQPMYGLRRVDRRSSQLFARRSILAAAAILRLGSDTDRMAPSFDSQRMFERAHPDESYRGRATNT